MYVCVYRYFIDLIINFTSSLVALYHELDSSEPHKWSYLEGLPDPHHLKIVVLIL